MDAEVKLIALVLVPLRTIQRIVQRSITRITRQRIREYSIGEKNVRKYEKKFREQCNEVKIKRPRRVKMKFV
jgi:hypothetical protein